jgi:ssDNA-binding Zn-finger/Zn-ribbon topoisomerase 1
MFRDWGKWKRIASLCSAIWLALAFSAAADRYDESFETSQFVIVGLVPILVLWGIIWIKASPDTAKKPKIEDFLVGIPLAPEIQCPRCGSAMKLMTTKTGLHAGKVFWGCSRHPTCIQIAPLAAGELREHA